MDHAYTLSGSCIIKVEEVDVPQSRCARDQDEGDNAENDPDEYNDDEQYDESEAMDDHAWDDSMEDDQDNEGTSNVAVDGAVSQIIKICPKVFPCFFLKLR